MDYQSGQYLGFRTKRHWENNPHLRPAELTCLTCAKFSYCGNPRKAGGYFCVAFRAAPIFEFEPDPLEGQLVRPRSQIHADFDPTSALKADYRPFDADGDKIKYRDPDLVDSTGTPIDDIDEEKESEYREMVDRIIDEEERYPVISDLKIDDRDLRLAPNFYTFLTSPQGLNIKKPYAKQIEMGVHTFAEWCPRCSDNKFVDNMPVGATLDDILERTVFLNYGKCPKCKVTKTELWLAKELKVPVELAGLAGQRSTKTSTLAMMQAYSTHGWLKIPNPLQTFDLLDQTVLHWTYVALTYMQAKGTIWDPLQNYLENSPWFKAYNALVMDYGNRHGEEVIKVKETFVTYRHKRLTMYPSGPDRRKLRGMTRGGGGIDEIGHINARMKRRRTENDDLMEEEVKMNAEEIYIAMRNSMTDTRVGYYNLLKRGYYSLPIPLFGNISSPTSNDDMICQLYRESQQNPEIYGFHYATWESNPKFPRESLKHIERRNPIKFRRDYAAVPPLSAAPFIEDIEFLKALPQADKHNGVSAIKHYDKATVSHKVMRAATLMYGSRDVKIPKIMCVDCGYSSNSFAIAVGHADMDMQSLKASQQLPEDGRVVPFDPRRPLNLGKSSIPLGLGKYIPVVDVMVEIIPTHEHPLNFTWIYDDILCPLIEKFNVRLFVTDRWQNLKIMSDIEQKYRIPAMQYTMRYDDFNNLREAIYVSRLVTPMPEVRAANLLEFGSNEYPFCFENKPIAHFMYQCLKVEDHKGKEVSKGERTTDDIFRAVSLLHRFLNQDMIAKDFCGTLSAHPRALGMVNGFSLGTGVLGDDPARAALGAGAGGAPIMFNKSATNVGVVRGRQYNGAEYTRGANNTATKSIATMTPRSNPTWLPRVRGFR